MSPGPAANAGLIRLGRTPVRARSERRGRLGGLALAGVAGAALARNTYREVPVEALEPASAEGEDDYWTPPWFAEQFGDAVPGAEAVRYDGVGHTPMEEVSAPTAADIRRFLAERRAGGQ